jgi:site-specific DNA-methyltransferase (adenine-specific)
MNYVRQLSENMFDQRLMLDVAATRENKKCKFYISEAEDGLQWSWREGLRAVAMTETQSSEDWQNFSCWMNPPYGREIGRWVKKAYTEQYAVTDGTAITVFALLPARTDTAWWHDWVMQAHSLWFFRGRLRFDGHENSAPFPSVLVCFRHISPDDHIPEIGVIDAGQFDMSPAVPTRPPRRRINTR